MRSMSNSSTVAELIEHAPGGRLPPLPLEPGQYVGWRVIGGRRYPLVECEIVNGQAIWWCRDCDQQHWHGATPDMWLGGAHRRPHCLVYDSPFRETGVILIPGLPGCATPPKSGRRRVWRDSQGRQRSGWSPEKRPPRRRR